MAKLVNLSNVAEIKTRTESRGSKERSTSLLKEYQGLTVLQRAKKAALAHSNNGKCWWVYEYIYRELTWRNKK